MSELEIGQLREKYPFFESRVRNKSVIIIERERTNTSISPTISIAMSGVVTIRNREGRQRETKIQIMGGEDMGTGRPSTIHAKSTLMI